MCPCAACVYRGKGDGRNPWATSFESQRSHRTRENSKHDLPHLLDLLLNWLVIQYQQP